MRLNFIGGIVAVFAVAALIVGYSSLFTVSQTQQALVLRLGQPRPPITEPGLHVKAPFIDSVVAAEPFWLWRTVGGVLMVSSHLCFAWNVWQMRPARASHAAASHERAAA